MAATQSWFWFFAGMLSGLAAAIILGPTWAALKGRIAHPILRGAAATGAVALLGIGVVLLYREVGRPDAVSVGTAQAAIGHADGAMKMQTPGGKVGSVEQEVVALADRLERNGGSHDDWMLLAQSYDFLGRPEDAAKARAQADSVGGAGGTPQPATTSAAPDKAALEARVAKNARDSTAWLALAGLRRQQRDYAGARDAFRKAIALQAMSADAWADYADVLGSLAKGSLSGEPARAIDSALALDPQHPKALWLKASLAHDEHRYTDALKVWKALRAAMPADSPDNAVIDGNIAEAAKLAGLPQAAAPVQAATEVVGTVSIDSRLAARVTPGATLFIYAKAADSPGPPLAVLRTTAGAWPVAFRLDDSMAMMPSRRLSSYARIVVEARVSKSGQATPSPGDLYVVSPVMRLVDAHALKLVISQEVG